MQIISDADKIGRKSWSDFVNNHPHGNIFQTPEMYEVYKNTKNYEPVILTVIEENNKILALLLAVIQRENSGFLGIFSARSIIFGGPLTASNNYEILDLLLNKYNQIVRNKVIYTQVRNFYNQNEIKRFFIRNGYKYVDHLNVVLDLSVGEDILWHNFSKSRKKGIKRALAENLTFEYTQGENQIKVFYQLLSITYKRIKVPIPQESHFEEIFKKINNNYQIFTIRKDGEVIVALFTLIYKNTIYGYYIGAISDNEIIKQKPNDLLFWEVFKWAINRKINFFDWMGAGKPEKNYGVRDFKLQYGGKPENLGRFVKIHKPLLYNLGKTWLQIWQKLY